jgi:CelD/BcsL family acetyltransferase involved in cellulose biosynthesis
MRAEVLATDAALHALRPEWEALWRRAAERATPFQSPAWLLPWWRAFGTGRPRAAVLRGDRDGRLLGLLPLYLLEEGSETKLLPVGVGVSDYLDALLDPDAPPDSAGRLLEAALAASPEATSCDLADLPPGAALRDAPAPPDWSDEGARPAQPCPVLALLPGATLSDVLSRRRRAALRNARNRAERAGGWAVRTADAGTLDECLGALVSLHRARWDARGEPGGVLADPRVLALHRDAAPGLLAQGALRLQVLHLGGAPAAAHYALLGGGGRVLLYLSGFDAVRAYESPGAILLGDLIEWALANGGRELHFLRGDEGYKYAWGAEDRFNAARRLVPLRGAAG